MRAPTGKKPSITMKYAENKQGKKREGLIREKRGEAAKPQKALF